MPKVTAKYLFIQLLRGEYSKPYITENPGTGNFASLKLVFSFVANAIARPKAN
ncbi:hypothetical protein GTQ43_18525 [Nostoc sp. KVJ3]|uniref:hypothetical protein n=1 Tax=Nostoc sp. KVJ3 TaxID=457945 RepID=UPI00223877D9|nr:hypothetical protein [Nostoc sp. KVJ3]MCW5315736.1 hypothetical protein [Nostoc sp. KVJ3]